MPALLNKADNSNELDNSSKESGILSIGLIITGISEAASSSITIGASSTPAKIIFNLYLFLISIRCLISEARLALITRGRPSFATLSKASISWIKSSKNTAIGDSITFS